MHGALCIRRSDADMEEVEAEYAAQMRAFREHHSLNRSTKYPRPWLSPWWFLDDPEFALPSRYDVCFVAGAGAGSADVTHTPALHPQS